MSDRVAILPNEPGWPVEPLAVATTLLRRGTAPVYVDTSDVSAIGQRCVTRFDFDPSAARPHSVRAMARVLEPKLGDVLVNSTGTGTIGRSVIFTDKFKRYIVDGHVTVVRPCSTLTTSRWINDVLRSPWGQAYLESHCYSGSTNQIELAVSALAAMPVPLPPVPVQRRIAEILDTLDNEIRATEEIIAKLKLANQGLLRNLLTRGINESGQVRDPDRNSAEFTGTALGQLPRRWTIFTCAELARDITVGIVIRPTQYYRSVGVPVLRSANVREAGVEMSDLVYMSPADHTAMAKSGVVPGDLVTVRTGYPGTTAVIPESLPAANCVDIIITRPGPRIRSDFLARWINSDLGKGQVLRSQGGLAQQHFNVSEMKSLLVAVPPLMEQAAIAGRVAAANRRLSDEARTLDKLHTVKRGLMADLLTGRVRVPVETES